MKKLLLWAVLLSAGSGGAQAQTAIPAGTVALGGMVGYAHFTNDEPPSATSGTLSHSYSENQFQFTPSIGYFVADNLAVGLDLGYLITKRRFDGAGASSTTTPNEQLRAGAYVQYYKMLTAQFGLVGTLGAGYQHRASDGYRAIDPNDPNVNVKSNGFYAQLTPGLIFFPTPKLGISASVGYLGYERMKLKSADRTESDLGAAFGFDQLLFGGTYYFGR
ncbi:outer membrane beta-barrel protein [Hymenobacter sp. ASUV-10]|uniref:Outer membrane beta-barrel protein n=1 Tax=Hymenobacter aranciens TaxID=3063996 RepID=A0ABT9B4K7_9BACT|nr:outer membrane beta-barrel protein [Hymenobacter sp. ASUV-10]MDO7873202.1 outer membrane beta-barrel protein [Hymenobacter sp. ASUV-10]